MEAHHDFSGALLISMHHAGLRNRRYGTLRRQSSTGGAADGENLGMEAAFADLEDWQRESASRLGLDDPKARADFWHTYQMLQVFDLLSLYLCWDGYDADANLIPDVVHGVPVAPGSDRYVDIHIEPTGPASVRLGPYPLDVDPLPVAVMARHMRPVLDAPEWVAQEAYYRARRTPLTWDFTS